MPCERHIAMNPDPHNPAFLLEAIRFAAVRHRNQRRKGEGKVPYINHPIAVARDLAVIGGVTDPHVLAAAVLHDTVEDTGTTFEEIEHLFGCEVRGLVEEVTDDKFLPYRTRKRLQIEHARGLSTGAKLIKLGDKLSNVRSLVRHPPAGWSTARRREYLDWTEEVIAGCRGVNAAMEQEYERELAAGRAMLNREIAEDQIRD